MAADERTRVIQEIINSGLPGGGVEDFRSLVNELIDRTLQWFSGIKRWILTHKMTMTEHGPHVWVVSTLN